MIKNLDETLEFRMESSRVSSINSSKKTFLKNEQSSCVTKITGMFCNNYYNHFGVVTVKLRTFKK
jgi:hypothetical protein